MIEFLNGKADKIDEKLALHFLACGAKNISAGEELTALLKDCEKLVLQEQSLRAAYAVYPLTHGEKLNLGFAEVVSRDLEKSLSGCNKIILFAATAGIGVDRLVLKYGQLAPSKATVIQACGAALVERWCDEVCAVFKKKYGANKFRYSCGYGDLPLTLQRDIFAALKLEKNLGISLSDKCIMTPSKSVTAIVGIKGNDDT